MNIYLRWGPLEDQEIIFFSSKSHGDVILASVTTDSHQKLSTQSTVLPLPSSHHQLFSRFRAFPGDCHEEPRGHIAIRLRAWARSHSFTVRTRKSFPNSLSLSSLICKMGIIIARPNMLMRMNYYIQSVQMMPSQCKPSRNVAWLDSPVCPLV